MQDLAPWAATSAMLCINARGQVGNSTMIPGFDLYPTHAFLWEAVWACRT